MNYILTDHAKQVIRERNILDEYIKRTIENPDKSISDKYDPELQHYLKKIPEYENRVLRIIVNISVDPNRIITVYFDRAMRGKL